MTSSVPALGLPILKHDWPIFPLKYGALQTNSKYDNPMLSDSRQLLNRVPPGLRSHHCHVSECSGFSIILATTDSNGSLMEI